eukprot:NODE_528_length_6433_cov_0.887907.p1 type:complete len:401 gc:universal NODE_528_length_6433_cov_0.887907:2900-1698(-)
MTLHMTCALILMSSFLITSLHMILYSIVFTIATRYSIPLIKSAAVGALVASSSAFMGSNIPSAAQSCTRIINIENHPLMNCQMNSGPCNRREVLKSISASALFILGLTRVPSISHAIENEPNRYSQLNHKGEDVILFVIDTGFDNALTGEFINPVRVIDFTAGLDDHEISDTWDYMRHGTYCTAIIGSKEYGIAPHAQVNVLKVVHKKRGGYIAVARALEHIQQYIQDHPDAKVVVNMSLGVDVSLCPNIALEGLNIVQHQIKDLLKNQVIIVKAAGNEGKDAYIVDPINRIPGVILVGAVDQNHKILDFANYGPSITINGPGSVRKTVHGLFKYKTTDEYLVGTSFAAPRVAAIIALLLSNGIKQQDILGTLLKYATHNVVQDQHGTPAIMVNANAEEP